MTERVPTELQHSAKKPPKRFRSRNCWEKNFHLTVQHIHKSQVSFKKGCKMRLVQIIFCVTATENASEGGRFCCSSHDR